MSMACIENLGVVPSGTARLLDIREQVTRQLWAQVWGVLYHVPGNWHTRAEFGTAEFE